MTELKAVGKVVAGRTTREFFGRSNASKLNKRPEEPELVKITCLWPVYLARAFSNSDPFLPTVQLKPPFSLMVAKSALISLLHLWSCQCHRQTSRIAADLCNVLRPSSHSEIL